MLHQVSMLLSLLSRYHSLTVHGNTWTTSIRLHAGLHRDLQRHQPACKQKRKLSGGPMTAGMKNILHCHVGILMQNPSRIGPSWLSHCCFASLNQKLPIIQSTSSQSRNNPSDTIKQPSKGTFYVTSTLCPKCLVELQKLIQLLPDTIPKG